MYSVFSSICCTEPRFISRHFPSALAISISQISSQAFTDKRETILSTEEGFTTFLLMYFLLYSMFNWGLVYSCAFKKDLQSFRNISMFQQDIHSWPHIPGKVQLPLHLFGAVRWNNEYEAPLKIMSNCYIVKKRNVSCL